MAARREDALEQQLNNRDEPPEGLDDPPQVDLQELIRLFDEEGFRREAFAYTTSGHTLHLWRAFDRARRLGVELSSLPWFLEHLDRVAERFARDDPQSDKAVLAILEMDGKKRQPTYDDRQARLAGAVLRWRDDHPSDQLDTALTAVAERFSTTYTKVKRAYHDFRKKVRRIQQVR